MHRGGKYSSDPDPASAVAKRGCLGAPSPAVLMHQTPPGHDLPHAFKPNRITNSFHWADKSL
ncbi:hypothetical protein D8I24_3669 [Cupriavidus necator H850]|nr:hypothetical protein D8I24_3669 [Cupriavidus necator H850]